MATWKIGIIGKGHVGSALTRGLARAGHEVRAVGRDPKAVRETGAWADVVFLAVPFGAVSTALEELGNVIEGKPLVDVTNALGPSGELALGFSTSAAEELQKKAPRARVVKAFNTVFAQTMETGRVKDQPATLFVAGDDAGAKEIVLGLGKDIGFDPVDAGPLKNARSLEPLALLNIYLGYGAKLGTKIGFRLLR
jgi:predicted dinucleotide-binding enzyme